MIPEVKERCIKSPTVHKVQYGSPGFVEIIFTLAAATLVYKTFQEGRKFAAERRKYEAEAEESRERTRDLRQKHTHKQAIYQENIARFFMPNKIVDIAIRSTLEKDDLEDGL